MSCEDGASEGGGGCDGDKGCGRAGDWPAGLVWALAENTCSDVPLVQADKVGDANEVKDKNERGVGRGRRWHCWVAS